MTYTTIPVRTIEAELRLQLPGEGGRQTSLAPESGLYWPHLRVGSEGEYLSVQLFQGPEKVRPGDSARVRFRCVYPGMDYSPLKLGARFEMMEGPNVVGVGSVVAVSEQPGPDDAGLDQASKGLGKSKSSP